MPQAGPSPYAVRARRPVAILVSKQRIVAANNGSSAYVLSLARTIRESGFDVWLIQPSSDLAGRTPILRFSEELGVFARHEILGMERIGKYAVALSPAVWWGFLTGGLRLLARKMFGARPLFQDRPRAYSIARAWTPSEHAFVQSWAEQAGAEMRLAIADYVFATESFSDFSDSTASAVIMHDLFSHRDGKGADSVAMLDEAEEIALLERADCVIAIQAQERDFVARECRDVQPVLAAMPAEVVEAPQPGEDDRLLFIGSDTAPNTVGLEWFLENVWPIILNARPDAELDVVGTVGRKFDTKSYPGVRILGQVDDLNVFYSRAGILISPLTFGSGLKIKLVEALGKGKAVVATSVTLQGVEQTCGEAVECHDDPEAMAKAIIALAGDKEARLTLGSAALACAETHFSAESAHGEFRAMLARILAE